MVREAVGLQLRTHSSPANVVLDEVLYGSLSPSLSAYGSLPQVARRVAPSAPPLVKLARERSSVRPPRRLPRPHEKPRVPSIPVVDRAWGYEENESTGELELQQPVQHAPNSACGPGAYSPSTELVLPCAPAYGFSGGKGREGQTNSMGSNLYVGRGGVGEPEPPRERPPTGDDLHDHWPLSEAAETIAPPRAPMPIAANLQRTSRRPFEPIEPQEDTPPLPGPSTYHVSPRGLRTIGATAPVPSGLRLPRQRRFHVRPHLALPLPDGHRMPGPRLPPALAALPFSASSAIGGGKHGGKRRGELTPLVALAPLAMPPPKPPPKPRSGKFAGPPPVDDGRPIEELIAEANARQRAQQSNLRRAHRGDGDGGGGGGGGFRSDDGDGAWAGDMFEAADGRPPPPGLDEQGQLLWRSFCTADANGDGHLSRREFFDALDSQGALAGQAAKWIAALKEVDENANAFIEWDEYEALGRAHPELVDMMRSISWEDRRSVFLNGTERVEWQKAVVDAQLP